MNWIVYAKGIFNEKRTIERALNTAVLPDYVRFHAGDTVYVFLGKPHGAIRFQAVVREYDEATHKGSFEVLEEYPRLKALKVPRLFWHGFRNMGQDIAEASDELVAYVHAAAQWSSEQDVAMGRQDMESERQVRRERLENLVGKYVIKRREGFVFPAAWTYLYSSLFQAPDLHWGIYLYRAMVFDTQEEAEEFKRDTYGFLPPKEYRNYFVERVTLDTIKRELVV